MGHSWAHELHRTGRRDGRDLYQMYIRDENKLSAVRLHAANNKYDEYPSKHKKNKTNKQDFGLFCTDAASDWRYFGVH
jgi:hypothetical protein